MSKYGKVVWHINSSTQWLSSAERTEYSGQIDFTPPGTYTLTITGTGAPSPADYATLKLAKNAFRKFLFTK